MRSIFLTGNGSAVSHLLQFSVTGDSRIDLSYFSECSLFDSADEFVRGLEPGFY
jgi:hypothetical protein